MYFDILGTASNSNLEFQVQIDSTTTGTWFTVFYSRREPLYDAAVGVEVTTNLVGNVWTATNTVEEVDADYGTNRVIKARVVSPAFTNTPALNVRLKATDL